MCEKSFERAGCCGTRHLAVIGLLTGSVTGRTASWWWRWSQILTWLPLFPCYSLCTHISTCSQTGLMVLLSWDILSISNTAQQAKSGDIWRSFGFENFQDFRFTCMGSSPPSYRPRPLGPGSATSGVPGSWLDTRGHTLGWISLAAPPGTSLPSAPFSNLASV